MTNKFEERFDEKFNYTLGAVHMDGSDPTKGEIKSFIKSELLALLKRVRKEVVNSNPYFEGSHEIIDDLITQQRSTLKKIRKSVINEKE